MLSGGIENFNILLIGGIGSAVLFLGLTVFFSNPKKKTNQYFFLLSITTVLWGIFNFLIYQPIPPSYGLWMIKVQAFFAVWQAYFLFSFTQAFVSKPIAWIGKHPRILLLVTVFIAFLTLTPLTFSEILEVNPETGILKISQGIGLLFFGIFNLFLVAGTFFLYLRNLITKSEWANIGALKVIATGSTISFLLIIYFNFFLPAIKEVVTFVPFALLFFTPIIFFTTYAVLRHKLFNAKAVAVSILIFLLSVVSLSEVVFAESPGDFVFSLLQFVLVILIGGMLLRGVVKEVKQREKIEELAKSLEKANVRLTELDRLKSEFVAIASHQLRSPLTAIKGYASLVLEGSFGKVSDSVKEAIQKIYESSSLMTVSVQDFLDVSRIEQGRMKYNFEEFDLEKLLTTVVEELTHTAKGKGLVLTLKITSESSFRINADLGKMKQILNNLIDNSIKYTQDGSVNVLMHHVDGKIRIEIHDTGVGIAPETLPKLFDKFVRSRNAHHVNVSGTGLGLFVVKQMVEAHSGRVWATSEGEGKGSVFHVELDSLLIN